MISVKKTAEQVFCYNFSDQEKLKAIETVMHKLSVSCKVLPEDSWREKVGFLLGIGGFKAAEKDGQDFFFSDEVMIFHHIKGKQLDRVLSAMKEAGIPPVRYKAVVTPYNTMWTLRRLCETMKKEHEYMTVGEAKKNDGKA